MQQMVTLLPASQKLAFRLKEDIHWARVQGKHGNVWIASNPWSIEQEQCSEHEYWLFHQLDSYTSPEELASEFEREFHPYSIRPDQIASLLQHGIRLGILEMENSKTTIPRDSKATSQVKVSRSPVMVWAALVLKLFQSKISLGSPGRLLSPLEPLAFFLFGRAGWSVLGVLAVASLLLVFIRWEQVYQAIPDWRSLRHPNVWLGYSLLFFGTRVVHELGHALACLRYRVRIADCGLLSSFGIMCPFVDVSHSWKCEKTSHRIVIALGGIVAELWLASFGALVWCFTIDGWIHDVAFQTMLLCSIVTLLFNANPLMKYDGYYVLCDLMGIQNLREKAWEAFDGILSGRSDKLAWGCLGLSTYFVASLVNRILVMITLGMFVCWLAIQWRLAAVGLIVCGLYLLSLFLITLQRQQQRVARPKGRQYGLMFRTVGWISASSLGSVSILMPIPSRVHTQGVLEFGERHPVYAPESGRLKFEPGVQDNALLAVGRPLLQLVNEEVERTALERQGRWTLANHAFHAKTREAFSKPYLLEELPWLGSQASLLEKQWNESQTRQDRLNLNTPVAGIFQVASVHRNVRNRTMAGPIDEKGRVPREEATRISQSLEQGEYVSKGDLIGWIQPSGKLVSVAEFSEEQIAKIRIGNKAKLRAVRFPGHIFEATVVEISNAIQGNPAGSGENTGESYRVRIELSANQVGPGIAQMLQGSKTELTVQCPDRSLLDDVVDLVLRNFKVR